MHELTDRTDLPLLADHVVLPPSPSLPASDPLRSRASRLGWRAVVGSLLIGAGAGAIGPVPVSATTPRVNATCSKTELGRTAGSLRCTKVGSRARWTRVAAASVAASSTTAASGPSVATAEFTPASPDQLPPQWPVTAPLPAGLKLFDPGTRPPSQYTFEVSTSTPLAVWLAWARRYGTRAEVTNVGGEDQIAASGPAFGSGGRVQVAAAGSGSTWIVRVIFL